FDLPKRLKLHRFEEDLKPYLRRHRATSEYTHYCVSSPAARSLSSLGRRRRLHLRSTAQMPALRSTPPSVDPVSNVRSLNNDSRRYTAQVLNVRKPRTVRILHLLCTVGSPVGKTGGWHYASYSLPAVHIDWDPKT